MRRITLCLMILFALIIIPEAIFASEGNVAKIGDKEYATLADAVAAVPTDGTETIITLLDNVKEGPGIVIAKDQNVIIDFNTFSYDASKPTVGSPGTETISMQILKGSTVILKNGTFTSTTAKRIIQNYSNLTLDNMVIDGTQSVNDIGIVASFNNGKVSIIGNTSILAKEGKYAFDNYFWPEQGYIDGAQVTINTTGTIKGNIELASSSKGLNQILPSTLTIKNIKHDGYFQFTDERFKNSFVVEGGTYTDLASAISGINKDNKEVTISLLRNVKNGPGIITEKGQNVIIDFNTFSYDASEPTVGSDGTKTNSCQLNKGSTVTFKNGTFTTLKAKRLIQNYADLTLDNMIIDGTKSSVMSDYVACFNSGKVNIIGNTTIKAEKGKNAFDMCWAPQMGYPNGTQITVDTTGQIIGDIELDVWGKISEEQKTNVKSTLTIKNINHIGNIDVTEDYLKSQLSIQAGKFSQDVAEYVAEDMDLVCGRIDDDFWRVGTTYKVIIPNNIEGGKVSVPPDGMLEGITIELVATPSEGYKLESLDVTDEKGNKIELSKDYKFVMPNSDVTVNAVFKKYTQEAEVPKEIVNSEKVEEILIETLKEALAEDPKLAEKIKDKNVTVEVDIADTTKDVSVEVSKKMQETLATKSENVKIAKYLNISIQVKDKDNNDKLISTIPEVTEAITFTVALPEDLPEVAEGYTRTYYIVRQHEENGKITIDILDTKLSEDGKSLEFASNLFSVYAIAYSDDKIVEDNTGDNTENDKENDKEDTNNESITNGNNSSSSEESNSQNNSNVSNPETGDNIMMFTILAFVSIGGMAVAIKVNKGITVKQ